jgi:WD40 repeat protein
MCVPYKILIIRVEDFEYIYLLFFSFLLCWMDLSQTLSGTFGRFAPDCRSFAVVDGYCVVLRDSDTLRQIFVVRAVGPVSFIEYAPDSKYLLAFVSSLGIIQVWKIPRLIGSTDFGINRFDQDNFFVKEEIIDDVDVDIDGDNDNDNDVVAMKMDQNLGVGKFKTDRAATANALNNSYATLEMRRRMSAAVVSNTAAAANSSSSSSSSSSAAARPLALRKGSSGKLNLQTPHSLDGAVAVIDMGVSGCASATWHPLQRAIITSSLIGLRIHKWDLDSMPPALVAIGEPKFSRGIGVAFRKDGRYAAVLETHDNKDFVSIYDMNSATLNKVH